MSLTESERLRQRANGIWEFGSRMSDFRKDLYLFLLPKIRHPKSEFPNPVGPSLSSWQVVSGVYRVIVLPHFIVKMGSRASARRADKTNYVVFADALSASGVEAGQVAVARGQPFP